MTKIKIIQSYMCRVCNGRHFRGDRKFIPHLQRSTSEEYIEVEQTDLVQDFGFPDVPKQLKIGGKKK